MTQLQNVGGDTGSFEGAAARRQDRLRDRLADAGVDGLLISRDCDIFYFTGFCGHDSLLLLHADGAVAISDSRYDEQLNPLRQSGVAEVVIGIRHRLYESVRDLCAARGLRRLGIQADHLTVAARDRLADALVAVEVSSTSGLVERLRMRKDEIEIAAIERAVSVNERALEATLPQIERGMTERDIEAILEFEMRRQGGVGSGFRSIIAIGAHGSLPHYETGEGRIEHGSSLLIDWGTHVGSYNSDLTRTFGLGSMPQKIREIYQIVLEAQMAAIDACAPGRICADIDAIARYHIASAGYGEFFGHGLGHGLGLEVHEAPYFNNLQTDVALEPGVVMTVEPGIYLPGVGGVRIEDDVLVTENGCRVLSSFRKGLDEVDLPLDGRSA